MLLLSSVGRASLLLLAAALLRVTSASLRAPPSCPSHLDCAKEGRHFCKTGSSRCGPCLYPLEENQDGICVVRKRPHQKAKVHPDLDEEIDFLHSVIEKQREQSAVRPGQRQSNNFAASSLRSDDKTTKLHAPAPKAETQGARAATAAPPPGPSNVTTNATRGGLRGDPVVTPKTSESNTLVIVVSVCVVAGTVIVIVAAVFAVKLQRDSRLAQKVDYPAFGGATVAPEKANGPSFGDQTLAQNAQMFHYQHQKQQMLSMGKQKLEPKAVDTDATSDEEEAGGGFMVYECPGLAPTGEMEVKNPLFDDSTLPYQGNHK